MRRISRNQRRRALICCSICLVLTMSIAVFAVWLSETEPVHTTESSSFQPVQEVSTVSEKDPAIVEVEPVPIEGLDPERPMIALTVDDSITDLTSEYCRVIRENGCAATFFVVGYLAEKYPEEVSALAKAGMEIGNHSYSHQQLVGLSQEKISMQVSQADAFLSQLLGWTPTLMRPPYGRVDEEVLAAAGHPVVLWSLDSEDAVAKSSEEVLEQLLKAKDGDIVRVHDGMNITLQALETGLPMLLEAGFQVTTVSDLFAVHGYGFADGCKYTALPQK